MKRTLLSSFLLSSCIHAGILAVAITIGRQAMVEWKTMSSRPISVRTSFPFVERQVKFSPVPELLQVKNMEERQEEAPPLIEENSTPPEPAETVQTAKKVDAPRPDEIQALQVNTPFDPPEKNDPHAQPLPPDLPIPSVPVIHDSDPIEEARPLYTINRKPLYPRTAIRNGWEGRVVLKIFVAVDGRCQEVNVEESSGYSILDKSALQAARAWEFEPARRNNKTMESWITVPVSFVLK